MQSTGGHTSKSVVISIETHGDKLAILVNGRVHSRGRSSHLAIDASVKFLTRSYEMSGYEVEIEDHRTCKCGMWPLEEYGPRCPSC